MYFLFNLKIKFLFLILFNKTSIVYIIFSLFTRKLMRSIRIYHKKVIYFDKGEKSEKVRNQLKIDKIIKVQCVTPKIL